MPNPAPAAGTRVPISDELITGPLSDLASVRLQGSRCQHCGETSLGRKALCPNCGRDSVTAIPLSTRGTLWTFTVVRHRPPGNYRGPEPFVPFGLGLVELPDGVRVLSVLDCPTEHLRVGLTMRFRPSVRPEPDGREVVVFSFEAVEELDA